MKLIVLWSLFIGYCIGGIVSLSLDQYTGERVRHPRKKALPRRQSQLKASRKVAKSR
jgi:hypothetical protein